MKYILASDPVEDHPHRSQSLTLVTGLLRGVMMNLNQQLGFPRIITTDTSDRPARAPACYVLWSYEFCFVIRTYSHFYIVT